MISWYCWGSIGLVVMMLPLQNYVWLLSINLMEVLICLRLRKIFSRVPTYQGLILAIYLWTLNTTERQDKPIYTYKNISFYIYSLSTYIQIVLKEIIHKRVPTRVSRMRHKVNFWVEFNKLEFSLPYFLPIAGGRIMRFIPFPRVSMLP